MCAITSWTRTITSRSRSNPSEWCAGRRVSSKPRSAITKKLPASTCRIRSSRASRGVRTSRRSRLKRSKPTWRSMTADSNNQLSRPNRKGGKANDYATKSKDGNGALVFGGVARLDAVRRRACADARGQSGFGDDLRLGRAQHWLGGDERARGGARRRAGGTAADGLHRFGERRRVEVGKRRYDIQAGLRQTARPIHRRGHD